MQKITLKESSIDQVTKKITSYWGPLGQVIYKWIYARWQADRDQTEEWRETVKRAIEGNINLGPRLNDNPFRAVIDESTTEAEQLFKLIYGLGVTPSG